MSQHSPTGVLFRNHNPFPRIGRARGPPYCLDTSNVLENLRYTTRTVTTAVSSTSKGHMLTVQDASKYWKLLSQRSGARTALPRTARSLLSSSGSVQERFYRYHILTCSIPPSSRGKLFCEKRSAYRTKHHRGASRHNLVSDRVLAEVLVGK